MAVRESENGTYYIIDLCSGRRLSENLTYDQMDALVMSLRDGSHNGLIHIVWDW